MLILPYNAIHLLYYINNKKTFYKLNYIFAQNNVQL
jgi:hypothetical protein